MADPKDPDHDDQAELPRPPLGAGPGPRMVRQQFMTPRGPVPPGGAMRIVPGARPPAAAPAQWAEDPSGRHQYRWWGGTAWTDHVADDGEASTDPLP